MWISKKEWEAIEKRITDLERQVQTRLPGAESSCSIYSFYADDEMYCRSLTISLCSRDWHDFEKQRFYPELMKYLSEHHD